MADTNDDIPPIPAPPADLAAASAVPPIESAPVVPGSSAVVPPTPAPAAPTPPPAAQAPAAAYGAPTQAQGATPPAYAAQPPAYGSPTAYGQPAYTPQPAGPAQGLSIASMITGIAGAFLSLFGSGFLPALAAVITGHMARKRQPWARPFWLTGLITGYIGLGLSLIWFIFVIGIVALGVILDPN